jgi:outer membrane protein
MTRLFALFVLLVVVLPAAQGQQAFTLQQAVDYATENHLRIQYDRTNLAEAEARIAENAATALPQVKASLNHQSFLIMPKSIMPAAFAYSFIPRDSLGNPVREPTKKDRQLVFGVRHSMTPAIQVEQLLFSGSYTQAKRASNAYREFAEQTIVVDQNAIEDQVQNAYLPAMLLMESIKTLDKNLTNLDRLRFETDEFKKAGFVEQLDVDRLDLTIANLRTERENLTRQLDMVLNALKFTMGYPLEQAISLSDNLESFDAAAPAINDLVGPLNFANRPEMQQIEVGKKLQSIQYDVVKAGSLPTVAAFANFQVGLSGDNIFRELFAIPTSLVGLSASIPLYDSGVRRHQLQRSKLSYAMLENQQAQLNNAFTLQVLNARISYQNASARVGSQTKNLALAERIYNTAKTKYSTGVGSSLEIVQAEQSLFQTQQNLLQARFDLLQAYFGLSQALGK